MNVEKKHIAKIRTLGMSVPTHGWIDPEIHCLIRVVVLNSIVVGQAVGA